MESLNGSFELININGNAVPDQFTDLKALSERIRKMEEYQQKAEKLKSDQFVAILRRIDELEKQQQMHKEEKEKEKNNDQFVTILQRIGELEKKQQILGVRNAPFGAEMATENGKGAKAFIKVPQGEPNSMEMQFTAESFHQRPGEPKHLKRIGEFPHGDVVSAVAMARNGRHAFTGGKGTVKMWDISDRLGLVASSASDGSVSSAFSTIGADGTNGRIGSAKLWAPVNIFTCLKDNSYVRSCKLFPDMSTLIVGGETDTICVCDVNSEKVKTTLDCEADACYALAISADCRLCFACCSSGSILILDIQNGQKVAQFDGHFDAISCADLSGNGARLWTGGLDSTVRCWDIRGRNELSKNTMESQVFTLACCPNSEELVAVGMENNNVELLNMNCQDKYVLNDHQSCVLSLKFANSGKWFVSTGKDYVVNCWRTPYGYRILKSTENSSLLSCDISHDDRFLLIGSGDKKATLYELSF